MAATVALAGYASGSAEQSAPPSKPDENRGFENRAAAERFLADDGQETIVTLTTLPALKQRYERLFEASLRTLRPTG